MSLEPPICLYNVTLENQKTSVKCCVGNFSGKKAQEIVVATMNSLIVYKPDTSNGLLVQLFSTRIFATIRSIANFKVAGSGKDYLLMTSDSGNLSVLELDLPNSKFNALFIEPFAKSGIRRLSPGMDIAVDPKGRSALLTAIEKNKLCYVFNRDSSNNLTVSSPLEANRSKMLTLQCIGLDVGYENPLFAALEIDYSEYENNNDTEFDKYLTFYELDLGLNNVVRKHWEKVSCTSNILFPVPGGNDGPSGVLVCSTNLISYRNIYGDKVSIQIPTNENDTSPSTVICGVLHQMKDQYFWLAQTDKGDIFKVELSDQDLIISYFDTIPICTSLIVLKSGFLFADCEYGDKYFYQFEKLGSDIVFRSSIDNPTDTNTFKVNEELDNLLLVDVLETLTPMMDSQLIHDDDSFTKILALTNLKNSSALKFLQYGVSVQEVVESDIPNVATGIWTTKLSKDDEFDKYLVISFLSSSLVLSIGESVEEVTDSEILNDVQTLGVQQIGENSIVQIYSNGIRQIKKGKFISEWLPPAGIKITTASTTNRQIAVGLSNNELAYFEIDDLDRLIEFNQRKEVQGKITSVSIGDIPEGSLRSKFLAVGCDDSTIRVLSLDPKTTLDSLSLQALSAIPNDLLIVKMDNQLFVNIGLNNGVYVRTLLDEHTGQLGDTRTKYLGNKSIKLSKVVYQGENIVLANSNKTWCISDIKGDFKIIPLLVEPLKDATIFNTEDCNYGVVGLHKKKLKIFQIENINNDFKIDSLKLEKTPKQFVIHQEQAYVCGRENGLSIVEKFNINDGELIANRNIEGKILALKVIYFQTRDEYLVVVSVQGNEGFLLKVLDLELNFIYDTPIAEACYAIIEFQGKLLAGIGKALRIMDTGKKQLLSKSLTELNLVKIVSLESQGNRVVVGDLRSSVTLCLFDKGSNTFLPFVDDCLTRYITSMTMVDYDTIIGGDKFGNLFMLRVPEEVTDDKTLIKLQDGFLQGCANKFDNICNFHVEDIVVKLQKCSFTVGGRDIIVYTGLQGTLGALIPVITRSDIKFFSALEKQMREFFTDLSGRMHYSYRGYYQPAKNVIDGDLIENFKALSQEDQQSIAEAVGKTVREINKKIYEIRSMSI